MSHPKRPPIRVAGMGAWLPGAHGLAEVRARIQEGPLRFAKLPLSRWDPKLFATELPDDAPWPELGATLGEVEVDWRSLRLPPLFAAQMHSMEKVALAVMAEALADAGIMPRAFSGERVRVFIAATTLGADPRTDHSRRIRRRELAEPVTEALADVVPKHASAIEERIDAAFERTAPPIESDSMMTSASILAGRVCNLFDFRGGHLAVDCSMVSSLAAVETAVEDLRAGVCDVAVVCAVSPMLTASGMLAMIHGGLLSSRPPLLFAPDAEGTVLGEGAIALVLDRGSGAPRATSRGWIESIAGSSLHENADDPLGDAVRRAAGQALDQAGIDQERVAFVATRTGGIPRTDRSEAAALAAVYPSDRRPSTLPLASSVPVFGHLSSASGMLAMLQALLALEAGRLDAPLGEDHGPVHGIQVGSSGAVLPSEARAGVSDAGLAPRAYHAILAAPEDRPSVHVTVSDNGLPEPLAITGMGLVVPGADCVATFWKNVQTRVDSIADLPRSRWDLDRFLDASENLGAVLKTRLAAPVSLPERGAVEIGGSRVAAELLDPALLLCLDSAGQALRDSNGAGAWNRERVAVIAGQLSLRWAEAELEKHALFGSHLKLVAEAMREAGYDENQTEAVLGQARARFGAANPPLSARSLDARTGIDCAALIARAWSFSGPVLTVDAACASSLAAIERSARKLAEGEVDAAVAVGVAYNLLPEYYVVLSILGALSSRGAPPFHLGADGFVPGEGAAAVVLERLSDAERRGAPIHAIIRGLGCSSDGAGVSIFAPNPEGQQLAIHRALEGSGWSARSVDLLEAHGTGTRLGDETEIRAYRATYGARDATRPLSVGTVKSQVGHLSSAAGMVGLVKSTLAVRDGILPPTLGMQPAPHLELDQGPLRLQAEARPWVVRTNTMRRAGISAFGLGGINYHLLVEQPPNTESAPNTRDACGPQAQLPARPLLADRFEAELIPVTLSGRLPCYSLRDRLVWIIPDQGERWRRMAEDVERRGAQTVVIDSMQTLESAPPADGILDLSTFGHGAGDALSYEVDRCAIERVTFALAAIGACYDQMARAPHGHSFYIAVTSLGGDLGLTGVAQGNLAGAALLGLAKGLKQELPLTLSRGIDFDPDEAAGTVADVVLRELEDGNDQLEVAWAGRRLVSRLRRLPLDDGCPLRPVRSDDIILVSGGGRGVVFECASALARLGATVVVCGRTPVPQADAPYLDFDGDAFETWGRDYLLRRRREDPTRSPRALLGEVAGMRRERELWANLERARLDDLPLTYACCDVTDAMSVRSLVADVRARYGPITGLAHGAMVQWSTLASRKEPDKIAKTLAVKSEGLANLLAATADDPLRVVLGFGSGAGRFGNRGQADYCAANALMAARIAAAGRADRRSTRFVTVDWTAWDSVGAAVEDDDLAALLRSTGITSISVEEGTHWFVREWTAGRASEVVVLEERMLHDWPFLGRQPEHDQQGHIETDDRGRPLVEGAWPMVDRVLDQEPGSLTVERCLSLESDAFLDQHRLHGVPILPATFGWEFLAEVAALSAPDAEVESAYDLRIETPAKLFHEQPLRIEGRAVFDSGSDIRTIFAETRSRLSVRGRELSERKHHTGRFRLRPRGSGAGRPLAFPELAGPARARSFFHMAQDPVTLGPLFSRGESIRIGDRVVTGHVRPPRPRDVMRRSSSPLFQLDPLLMDTAFQIAANWDGYGNGYVSIPYAMAELRVGRRRRSDEGAQVYARVTRVEDPDVYYDIDVAGDDDEMLMEIRGLHLRRIAKGERGDAS